MMNLMFAAIALTVPQTAPGSGHQAPAIALHAPPPPSRVSGDHAALPVTFVAGLPTISVMIDGKGPFRLGFDTGAPGAPHLTDRLAAALGLAPSGEIQASDPTGRNPVTLKLYRLGRVAFGSVTVEGWTGSAAPARPGRLESIDGIIGLDAFRGYVVTLDYGRGRLLLDRGALRRPDGRRVFGYADIVPTLPLTIEGHMILAHLDTGNVSAGVAIPESFAALLTHKAQARAAGQAHTLTSTIDLFALPIDGQAHVGATPLGATDVTYPSLRGLGNIGSPALRGLIVRVDPANRRVMLEPVGP